MTRGHVLHGRAWLAAVAQTASAVAQEPDGPALCRRVCALLAERLEPTCVAVAIVREGVVHDIVAYDARGEYPLPPNLETVMQAIAARRVTIVAESPAVLLADSTVSPASLGWSALLVTPVLHHGGHPLAVLCVAGDAALIGAEETPLAVEAIAGQLSAALDRADMLDRLAVWSNGMEALLNFSTAVHRHGDPAALLSNLVEHAAQFLKADGGRSGLASIGPGGAPTLVSDMYWRRGHWQPLPRRWGRGEGLPGRVLDHEFSFVTADYVHDAARDDTLVERDSIHHAVCVPLRDSTHHVVGFLELHRGLEQPAFTWSDAAFLEALADTTALAIENSRLVTALADKSDEIRRLFALHAERIEEERQHMARELHDEAGQALVGVKLALQVLARMLPADLPQVREPLDELRGQINQATARFRQLARRLRPPALDQHGLEAALAQLVHETERRCGVGINLSVDGLGGVRHLPHETAVFRIVQEALTNVCTHASANQVWVAVHRSATALEVSVRDDGCGFDTTRPSAGLGLRGVSERVTQLKGSLTVTSAPGRGTVLEAILPWA